MKKQSKKRSKKGLLLAALAVAVLGFGAYRLTHRTKQDTAGTSGAAPQVSGEVNLAPPTEEEKQAADDHKQEIVNQDKQAAQSTPTATSSKKQVSVIITHADVDSVNSYVSGVVEDGGTCTATFTKSGQTVTRTSEGFANVSTTNCEPITPNLPSSGTWTLVLSYASSKAAGQAQTTVKVP